MTMRISQLFAAGIMAWLLVLGASTLASEPTPLEGGLEVRLLPGFTHERRRGEHGPAGRFVRKGGPEIHYEMGRIGQGDAPTSGDYRNSAQRVPEADRQWLKEQSVAGRQFHVAYTKNRLLIVSSVSAKQGINFWATAESDGDVADVLLIVLTLAEQKARDNIGEPD